MELGPSRARMVPGDGTDDRPVRLPTRQVVLVRPGGVEAVRSTVHCPLKMTGQSVPSCLSCQRLHQASTDALVCSVPAGLVEPRGVCGELVPHETVVLDAELPVFDGLRLLQGAQLASAPVVDDNASLLGTVLTSELAALCDSPGAEVEDAIIPVVAVNEHLTILELAQLMDSRDLERTPIVDDTGHLLGVVTALDVVRWFSRRLTAVD
ncbi:MAG: CBS domain-containing protein [Archangium sp.]|nr:CBS domain-containing protein [Archangium sp.]